MPLSRRHLLQGLSAAGVAALAPRTLGALPDGGDAMDEEPMASPATTDLHPLTPVPLERVVIDDEFWAPKYETWRKVTIGDCFRKFEAQQGGALNNFDRVRDGLKGGHGGNPWQDGLIYEMIRGAADFLRNHPDPVLEAQLDGYIARICAAAAKDPGGYVNTYTQLGEPEHRWGLNGGLEVWQHEFYNLGALVDAGVYYYRATGKTPLLDAAVRIANTMSDLVGPAPKKNLVPAHELPEEAMLGLYELLLEQPSLKAKLTAPADAPRYLALAEFWIENRGRNAGIPNWEPDRGKAEEIVRKYDDYAHGRPTWGAYAQDDKPVFEQEGVVGHAVRSTLLCSAVAAVARVNDRKEYRETAVRLWENMTFRRMHVTGGVGAFANEEAFGPDYVLPNDAYLETCAAVGAGFFHANMNRSFGHARYADELERVLFNGVLCGTSLSGDTYNYQNPLVSDEKRNRWEWHDCPCCPPMFLKILGAMPGYVYATDADAAYVNLYVGSRATMSVKGAEVALRQTTEYPWQGKVRVAVDPAAPAEFGLMLRIPAWCKGGTVRVNGEKVSVSERVRGYVRVQRTWQKGDVVEIDLPMPVEALRAHPMVRENLGRVALARGPVVYCIESVDNGNEAVTLARNAEFATESWRDRLDGVTVIRAAALGESSAAWNSTLYAADSTAYGQRRQIVAIPFFANGNRGPARMAVWLPRES